MVPSRSDAASRNIASLAVYMPQYAARITCGHDIGWNVIRDDTAGTYNAARAYGNPRKYYGSASDPASVADCDRQGVCASFVSVAIFRRVRRKPFG